MAYLFKTVFFAICFSFLSPALYCGKNKPNTTTQVNEDVPLKITLRLNVEPERLGCIFTGTHKNDWKRADGLQNILGPTSFKQWYKSISLTYAGEGYALLKNQKGYFEVPFSGPFLDNIKLFLKLDRPVFFKNFLYTTSNIIDERTNQRYHEGTYRDGILLEGVQGLYHPVGGAIRDGLELNMIAQVFMQIKSGFSRSTRDCVRIEVPCEFYHRSVITLRKRSLDPRPPYNQILEGADYYNEDDCNEANHYAFHSIPPNHPKFTSLGEDISNGSIKFNFYDKEKKAFGTFKSYKSIQKYCDFGYLDIEFRLDKFHTEPLKEVLPPVISCAFLKPQTGYKDENSLTEKEKEVSRVGRPKTKEHTTSKSRSRSVTPEPLDDTYYNEYSRNIIQEISLWRESKEALFQGKITAPTILRSIGYYGLEALNIIDTTIDSATYGGWSAITEGLDKAAHLAEKYTRRGVRSVTGDQRWGQNAGNYLYLALSLGGPKKIVAPAKLAHNLNKTRMFKALDLAEDSRIHTYTQQGSKVSQKKSQKKSTASPRAESQPLFPGETLVSSKNVVDASNFSSGSKIIPLERRGRVMFDDVEFRAVRDLGHMPEKDLHYMMETGKSAYDKDNIKLIGHHNKQQFHRNDGAFIVEIPEQNHSISNLIQHPNGNKKGTGLSREQRADWRKVKKEFNKERAKEELIKRGLLNE